MGDPDLSPAQVRQVAACMVWVSRWAGRDGRIGWWMCMYACFNVYTSTYVCIYRWMGGLVFVCTFMLMCVCMNFKFGWMCVCICMEGWLDGRMDGCNLRHDSAWYGMIRHAWCGFRGEEGFFVPLGSINAVFSYCTAINSDDVVLEQPISSASKYVPLQHYPIIPLRYYRSIIVMVICLALEMNKYANVLRCCFWPLFQNPFFHIWSSFGHHFCGITSFVTVSYVMLCYVMFGQHATIPLSTHWYITWGFEMLWSLTSHTRL